MGGCESEGRTGGGVREGGKSDTLYSTVHCQSSTLSTTVLFTS